MLHPNTKNSKNITNHSTTTSLSSIQPSPKPNIQKTKTQPAQNTDSGFHKKFSLQDPHNSPQLISLFPEKQTEISKKLSTPNFRQSHLPQPQNQAKPLQFQRNKPLSSHITKLTTNDSCNSLAMAESQVVEVGSYDIKITIPKSNHLKESITQSQFFQPLHQNLQTSQTKNNSKNQILTLPSQLAKSSMLNKSTIFNDNRIRLRDYLFMANTSTALAAEKKRTLLLSSKTSLEQSLKKQQPPSVPQARARQLAKNSYAKQKYRISSNKMANILKNEISNDITQLKTKINEIQSWVGTLEAKDNDQLTKLYSIRRQIQNYYSNLLATFPPPSAMMDLPLNESLQFSPEQPIELQDGQNFVEI